MSLPRCEVCTFAAVRFFPSGWRIHGRCTDVARMPIAAEAFNWMGGVTLRLTGRSMMIPPTGRPRMTLDRTLVVIMKALRCSGLFTEFEERSTFSSVTPRRWSLTRSTPGVLGPSALLTLLRLEAVRSGECAALPLFDSRRTKRENICILLYAKGHSALSELLLRTNNSNIEASIFSLLVLYHALLAYSCGFLFFCFWGV